MSIDKNIRKLRKSKGLTQRDLAEKLDVHHSHVSKWEKGTVPQGDTVLAIAHALGVSVSDLYDDQPTTSASDRVFSAIGIRLPEQDAIDLEKLCSTQEGRELLAGLLEGFVAMSDDQRRALATIAKIP